MKIPKKRSPCILPFPSMEEPSLATIILNFSKDLSQISQSKPIPKSTDSPPPSPQTVKSRISTIDGQFLVQPSLQLCGGGVLPGIVLAFTDDLSELDFFVALLEGFRVASFYAFFGEPRKDLFLQVTLEEQHFQGAFPLPYFLASDFSGDGRCLFPSGEGIEGVGAGHEGGFVEGGEEHELSLGLNIRALPIKVVQREE